MARIRSIKPEFWTDEKVVALSPLARLLFIGLWNFCDDYGRMEFSLRRIKLQILPSDPTDCSGEFGEIRREGLVQDYEVDGKHYLQIVHFEKHQKVDRRSSSRIPPPPPNSPESRRVPPNSSPGGEGKGREKEKEEGRPAREYQFRGQVIRLTAEQIAGWEKTYHGIPDLTAELWAIDAKFAADPPPDWYGKLSGWLNQKHQKLLEGKREKDRPPPLPRGEYLRSKMQTIR